MLTDDIFLQTWMTFIKYKDTHRTYTLYYTWKLYMFFYDCSYKSKFMETASFKYHM